MFSFNHPKPRYSTIAEFNDACLNYMEITLHCSDHHDWATHSNLIIDLCRRMTIDGEYPDYGPDIHLLDENLRLEIQNNRNQWVCDIINTLLDNHGMESDYRCYASTVTHYHYNSQLIKGLLVTCPPVQILESDYQCYDCNEWIVSYPVPDTIYSTDCYHCQKCVNEATTRIQSIVRQRQAQIRVIRNLHLTGRV